MTDKNPAAAYVCINLSEACAPWEIKERSICISEDIAQVLKELAETGKEGR